MGFPRREISILDSYEQLALLKQPNPRAPTGLRNLCIISLMLKIGMRVNEAVNLKDNDIDWDEGWVRIASSGAAKERILYLDKPELSLLKKWQNQKPADCVYFFCTLDGSKLQDRYIREMIKRLAKKAGLEKDVYPHLLRYTFAVEFIRETGDLAMLQEALGHRDNSATQNYAKLLFDNIKYSYNEGIAIRRSGFPVTEEKPVAKQSEAENKHSIVKPAKAKEINAGSVDFNKSLEEAGKKHDVKNPGETDSKKEVTSPEHLDKPESDDKNAFKPRIAIDEEPSEPSEMVPIPSIKCSNCNYILRYRGDCPKCGISFAKIMEHWRRFV